MAMMDPRLATTGFGSYRNSAYTWQMAAAVNVSQGMTAPGAYPVYFPGNNSTEPLTGYSGNESPNPQLACPGYTGLPLFVEVGANVNTAAGPVHTLVANATSLPNCVIDSSNATFASYLKWRGGVIVFPQQPLQNGTSYTVAVTVNSVPYTWSFTVGSTLSGGPPPVMPFKGLYTLDGWGGVHADNSPPVTTSAYWYGWSIARTAKPLPGANSPQSGAVLDGWGGLHPYGTPITISTSAYWYGWDIARKVVIFPDGTGGYVMDAWGGLHSFGINRPSPVSAVATSAYWPGWSIARDIQLVPGDGNHSGYVMDGWGGMHPFHPTTDGSTMPPSIATAYWYGWDIARSLWFLPGSATAGYTLDGYGGIHPFGGAPQITGFTYWLGWDIARTLFGA